MTDLIKKGLEFREKAIDAGLISTPKNENLFHFDLSPSGFYLPANLEKVVELIKLARENSDSYFGEYPDLLKLVARTDLLADYESHRIIYWDDEISCFVGMEKVPSTTLQEFLKSKGFNV